MFGSIFGTLASQRAMTAAANEERRKAEMQAMHDQQMVLHKAMTVAGAKMVIMKPDGTIIPIYD